MGVGPQKDFKATIQGATLFPLIGSKVAPAPLNIKQKVISWDSRTFGADVWLSNHHQKEHARVCWNIIQDYALRLIALEALANRFSDGDLKTAILKMVNGDFGMLGR